METPQRRQKSWFSSLTGLVSGSRHSTREEEPSVSSFATTGAAKPGASTANSERASSRPRLARPDEDTPARHSGTFSAPPVESPESPVKRASPTQLAQRKIHDRVQGPSGRLTSSSSNLANNAASNFHSYSSNYNNTSSNSYNRAASTPRRTNFSSATTPRNMFRDSISREMPAFTFTPRIPPNTMRGNFPIVTPGRSYRAPGIELSAREMAKISSSDLFTMKIPDPDPTLSGEAIANMVPKDLKSGNRSVYANEYLAHLCPPDFNEEQRNQFFCILDLRRLKYAADEVFLKKDWRLNILNFAKEYEKNRSLIMLRYGLYEFKTVKVSKDIFQKWKAANNIPDMEDDDAEEDIPVPAKSLGLSKMAKAGTSLSSKPNGTEGILRTGKRKAQDNIDPHSTSKNTTTFSSINKRSRPLEDSSRTERTGEREPLAETSTPALNKSKRKATGAAGADQLQRAKLQKPTPNATPSAAPSATKSFLERVANSPAKDDSAAATAATPSIHVSKPSPDSNSGSKPSSLFKSSTLGQLPKPSQNGSLARSVLESGLKASSAQNNNIFGYLSDASSAKGSGNDHADADAEDTDESDGQGESEAQEVSDGHSAAVTSAVAATRQPSGALFSTKAASSSLGGASALFGTGSSASSEASEAAPGRSLFDRINKGSDGQPLRAFGSEGAPGSSVSAPLFGSKPASERASPEKEAASSLFAPANKTWTPDSPIKFAASNTGVPTPAKSLFGTTPAPGASAPESAAAVAESSPFKFGPAHPPSSTPAAATTSTPSVASPSTQSAAAPLFGHSSKPTEPSTAPLAAATSPAFGTSNGTSSENATSLFGKALEQQSSSNAPATAATAGSSTASPSLQSQPLFGKVPESASGLKRAADDASTSNSVPAFAGSADAGAGASLFGATKTNTASDEAEPQAKRPLFGSAFGSGSTGISAPPFSAPLFSFGAPKSNGDSEKDKPSEVPTAAKHQEVKPLFGGSSGGNLTEPPKAPALFGATTSGTGSSSAGSIFNFGSASNANNNATTQPSSAAPLFSFGSNTQQQTSTAPAQSSFTGAPSFGGGGNDTGSAGSSFTFSVGGAGGAQSFHNPFALGDGDASSTAAAPTSASFTFGAGPSNGAGTGASPFQFGAGTNATTAAPESGSLFSFGAGASQPSSQQAASSFSTPGSGLLGNNAASTSSGSALGSSSIFNFGAGASSSQPTSAPLFGQQKSAAGTPLFNLAPPLGGTSTGTSELSLPAKSPSDYTPFTNLGGASSLATTPATGTPEPGATQDNTDNSGHQADGDEAPQEQISLTEGGPGEEDEAVVHEVRAKALRLVTAKDESEESESPASASAKSPWRTEGVGPLRLLKHKATGAVRLLLRAEPRGNVALNKALLPDFNYKPEPNAKYVKLTTANESGSGLETWMLQVKTKEAAQKLADALEANKSANKK